MAKKTKKEPLLNEESELYARLKDHLYSKKALFGEASPFSDLLQGMVNQLLDGEMDHFLSEQLASGTANKRNGRMTKTVKSTSGPLQISTPRDRNGDFEPEVIAKRQGEISSGLDDQILALYAQGNSVEDVRRLLRQMYAVDISAGKISMITDKVLPEIERWRTRPLQPLYAVVYLDAVYFKVRSEGRYQNRAFYTVYSIDMDGQRDLLSLYIQAQEGAVRWGNILQDLRQRGVEDILIACTDDLQGLSSMIGEFFPKTVVQKCIVHQMRNSLRLVDDKDAKEVAADLRKVYTTTTREAAQTALAVFQAKWGEKYPFIEAQWQAKWDELMAFLDFPTEMRRMIYTTNPVEALHRIVRKLIKGKAAWVSDTALMKQLYLSLKHNKKSWCKQAYGWKSIQRELLHMYPERIGKHWRT